MSFRPTNCSVGEVGDSLACLAAVDCGRASIRGEDDAEEAIKLTCRCLRAVEAAAPCKTVEVASLFMAEAVEAEAWASIDGARG